jgi:hypothetical protein
MLDKTADSLHRAHAAGVTMVAGTDTGFATTPYGEWHARELERSRVQASAELTRAVVHDGERAVPDSLPWPEEEARDLLADLTRRGRAAQATADEAAVVAPQDVRHLP